MEDGGDKPSTPSEDDLLAQLAFAPEVTPQTALLGTRLGRYEIDSVVGRGGMGIVLRARDTVLDREVALKLVPPDMLSDPERRARFVREARSAAAATHANIAAVYDVGEIDGQVFLAMELVEGETLRARIRRAPLATEEAVVVARGIARGLSKAHEKGIIHRDLKPDNVMIGEALHVKLLDFGLAKLREAGLASGSPRAAEGTLTYDGRVLGTPSYMSPEQAKGKLVDARTDLFSFGVVFYELLAGERPFRGDSAIEILSAVVRDEPAPLPREISPELCAIVARCLEKDPERRYPTAKDLLADLEGLETSTPSGLRAPARAVEPARPRPRLVAVAIAVVAAAIGAVALARHAPTPSKPAATATAPPGAGKAVTDHPRPRSHSQAALSAYGSALQNFRDGSIAFAVHELGRATVLDPELAAAHLRILLIESYKMDTTKAREHFAAASQHRASLDERDVALLQASEELIRERPDHAALTRAMTAVAERWPDDAELAWFASTMLGLAGRVDDAKTWIRRSRALDPKFAAALWYEASLLQDDTTDAAVLLLDDCLRISPAAASCLRIRSGIRAARGDCAGFEADARRMTEIEPRGPRAYEYLAAALAARGAPIESVRASLDKRASLAVSGTADSAEMRAQAELWPALLSGDFVAAETAALALDRLADHESSELAHVVPALTLIDIYEERGEPDRALGVAEAFVRRLPAWTMNSPSGVRARLVGLHRRAGKIDEAKARAEREALAREGLVAPHSGSMEAMHHWLSIEAQYVSSPAEAKAAIARLPEAGDADVPVHGFDLWPRGKVELLSGHRAEAARSLQKALATCTAMPTTDSSVARVPFSWIEAQLLLGEALEAPAACDAYARVIERWKDARPRSVSVEKARARARARGCAPS